MARPALMGIDLGTTAVKVGLFDAADGRALAVERDDHVLGDAVDPAEQD